MERHREIAEEQEVQETNTRKHDIPRAWRPSSETIAKMQTDTGHSMERIIKNTSVDSEYQPSLDKETLAETALGQPVVPSDINATGDTTVLGPPARYSSIGRTSDAKLDDTHGDAKPDLDELRMRDDAYRKQRLAEIRDELRKLESK